MLKISSVITIPMDEIELHAIRSQGAGGQNVNKVSTAIHLRFDIKNSTLPNIYKQRLLVLKDKRISKDGIIVIKAQQFRSQKKNKHMALSRLEKLISNVLSIGKKRIPSKPTLISQKKRIDNKIKRGQLKILRSKVTE